MSGLGFPPALDLVLRPAVAYRGVRLPLNAARVGLRLRSLAVLRSLLVLRAVVVLRMRFAAFVALMMRCRRHRPPFHCGLFSMRR